MSTNLTELKPNRIGTLADPVNIAIMSVDDYIQDQRALPVTTSLMMEPSTNIFHENGLYSEPIFGLIGSPDRMVKFGYIELGTQIFHPKIYQMIVQLSAFYGDLMQGTAYGVFDPVTKAFKRVHGDPQDTPGAGTGYSFFLHYFPDLVFHRTGSTKRDERIEVIHQYKDRALIKRYLVEPAGLRDIANDSAGRLVQDDINKLYTSLLLYSQSIPRGSQSILYDPVRYQLQSKAQEIFEYIENFLDGKRGFIQGSFARRKVAMGTRNVITASPFIAASPEDPQLHKADEAIVGIYQTIKGLQPFTKHALKLLFLDPVFKPEAVSKIALSDPKTGELVYTSISPATRDRWTSSDGMDKLINSFRNTDLRNKPVIITDTQGEDYALLLVYDEGDEIALCRSIQDLQAKWPRPVNLKRLRPITYAEMFYLIADVISMDKHGIITRYPAIEQGSSYVAELHVASTSPARSVKLINLLAPDLEPMVLKQYPVMGNSYMDALMPHPSKLAALGADFDGDFTFNFS